MLSARAVIKAGYSYDSLFIIVTRRSRSHPTTLSAVT